MMDWLQNISKILHQRSQRLVNVPCRNSDHLAKMAPCKGHLALLVYIPTLTIVLRVRGCRAGIAHVSTKFWPATVPSVCLEVGEPGSRGAMSML